MRSLERATMRLVCPNSDGSSPKMSSWSCMAPSSHAGPTRLAAMPRPRARLPTWWDDPMADRYDERDEAEQVEALRPIALRAAEAFGLDVARMEVVLHAYNTTFAVDDAGGRRFAVRVGTNSGSTPANAIAQQAWVRAIAEQTDVVVPVPLRTRDGAWFVESDAQVLGRPVLVTIASWLEGDDADALTADAARALGRTMAALHAHAGGWTLPPGGELPRFDRPLFGDEDALDRAPGLSAVDRAVLADARARAEEVFERLHRGAELRPLHADLHGGNLKWHRGRLAVFDFDDAGLGLPVLDLAISAFYLRADEPVQEEAMLEGYAEVAPLPDILRADFEALVAARQLLLANSLLVTTTADLRAQSGEYTRVSVARLRHWLETGVFTRALPDAA
ncbi:phosphotransferase [Agrococcus sediminis]|uniref:Phosphotransferase n=2 Tax=Agrococcus sediminis TaxID=2599924 RepID=A0A5M8Q5G4_9MICO|nr:phosphotransferase [Agrococcus sediminis]